MGFDMHTRKCSGCGNIHPGPFWDDRCPVVAGKKEINKNIIEFCSELNEYLLRCEKSDIVINEIKKILTKYNR